MSRPLKQPRLPRPTAACTTTGRLCQPDRRLTGCRSGSECRDQRYYGAAGVGVFSVFIAVLLTYAGSIWQLSIATVLMYQAAWSALSIAVCALKQHS